MVGSVVRGQCGTHEGLKTYKGDVETTKRLKTLIFQGFTTFTHAKNNW